ncbi:superfamily I DNA/RNA helicase [Pseudomonas sp. C 49-2]|uniref:UvrD-helicase domain-containing protein n=1 Tax=Pseudomonas TaxID=286 RepID=UPI000F84449A|nr:UvrD-helicase domain-containing protein [Pseudomonas sp. C 49-2]RTY02864.1 superfamily I DNA/RNA helicase [Pseudomonas sp. C 49-2]
MNTSWWRTIGQISDAQRELIRLPPHGKHLFEGPPGSGKTNLLLLRAEYMAVAAACKNSLILTYTGSLANFIRSGIGSKQLISKNQIKTYHSWAYDHIINHLGERPLPDNADFDEKARLEILRLVVEANKNLPSPKLYDAIFVDEAQDLTVPELRELLRLSDNICICGDTRQGIYNRNGLDIAEELDLEKHTLTEHFRIGHKIAKVADKLLPPMEGQDSLESTSKYNSKIQGDSSAKLHPCKSRDEQFDIMLGLIKIQLEAFNNDSIGIFCGNRSTRQELRDRFDETELSDKVCVHGIDQDPDFLKYPIHILTIHGAKGTEFRAVHIFGTEELKKGPLKRTKLSYTAVTRAKTALNAYKTGDTTPALESAFAEPVHIDLQDLFEGAQ